MSMESDLSAVLKTICPRTFPDVAPANTTAPWITWQGLGGETLRYGDNEAPDKRHTLVQISVWTSSRLESLALIHKVEEAICSYTWQAKPTGEASSTYEPDTKLYGSIQRFEIFGSR